MTDVGIQGQGAPIQLPEIVVGPYPSSTPKAPPPIIVPQNVQGDPWAGFTDQGAQAPSPPITVESGADPWAGFTDQGPRSDERNRPQMSQLGAGARGLESGLTFGFGPALEGIGAGLAELPPEGGGYFDTRADKEKPEETWARVRKAWDKQQKQAESELEASREQYPVTTTLSEIGGSALAPVPGLTAARDAGILARSGRAALQGGVGGAAMGAGEAVSQGADPLDVAIAAGKGAGAGAVLGGAGSGVLETAGAIGGRVASAIRGARDVDAEASRRIVEHLRADTEARGNAPAFTPEELAAANAAGTPRAIGDVGGESTRALMRSAANTSPVGREALQDMVMSRYAGQGERVAGAIERGVGGGNSADDIAAIQQLARTQNRGNYARAYLGANGQSIWSPELERLAGAPAVRQAMGAAVERGQNRATADGFGAFNPGVTVTPDGRLVFQRGRSGVPTYPAAQYWDYVQRELRDATESARRSGRNEEAGAIGALHGQLLRELDRINPDFRTARRGAAAAFGAEDALDAGRRFVMGMNSEREIGEARRAVGRMTTAERELFARGFGLELSNRVLGLRDGQNVVDQAFLRSSRSRAKIDLALGPQRADELEALLRVEGILDRQRRAVMGNSTTLRQAAEAGLAGAGAVGAFEAFREHDFNPTHVLIAALTLGAARHGAQVIDERVARRVGEMLASQDPNLLRRGLQIASRSPVMMNALRAAAHGTARVAAQSPVKAIAAPTYSALSEIMSDHQQHDQHEPDLYGQQ